MHGRKIAAHISFVLDPSEDHSMQRMDQPAPFRARDTEALEAMRRLNAETAQVTPATHASAVHRPDEAGRGEQRPVLQPWQVEFIDLSQPREARNIEFVDLGRRARRRPAGAAAACGTRPPHRGRGPGRGHRQDSRGA